MDNFAELLSMFKVLIGINDIDDCRNAELTALLNGSIVSCEKYVTTAIARKEVTEHFADRRTPIRLHHYPVGSLVSVSRDGVDVTSSWKIIDKGGFAALHLSSGGCDYIENEGFSVVYEAGFVTVPYDLLQAISYVAAAVDAQNGLETYGRGITKESITGVGTIEYDANSLDRFPPRATAILDRYKRY